MKRRTGRPTVYDDNFYLKMYHEHQENYSISQMAEVYKVSLSTVKNWIRKGKEVYAKSEQGK